MEIGELAAAVREQLRLAEREVRGLHENAYAERHAAYGALPSGKLIAGWDAPRWPVEPAGWQAMRGWSVSASAPEAAKAEAVGPEAPAAHADDAEPFIAAVREYRRLPNAYLGVLVRRASAEELGWGVLGRCFPYLGIIEIRNDLYGEEFHEVLTHELTHWKHPELTEWEVRQRTRMQLTSARWH